jgi:citrate lyase subunit beta/citryl-CoA lyase
MIARSYLFVPANRPDRFDKALASGAHAVILDLEDALAPSEKVSARGTIASWLDPAKPVVLRVNSTDSEWFDGDLDLASRPGIATVMLPKVGGADDVNEALRRLPAGMPVLPFIESARGVDQSKAIARLAGVQRLVFGHLDLMADLRIEGDTAELDYFRSHLVLTSRVAGIAPPVDGITPAIRDDDALLAETRRAKRFGFGAKLCIHPSQVRLVNECFRPGAQEIAWARTVVDALERSKGGVAVVDGRMIDRPVLLQAQEILKQTQHGSESSRGSEGSGS